MTASIPATPKPAASASSPPRRRRVTDAPTRLFHWGFALGIGLAWLTADTERWRVLHVNTGYVLMALLAWRLAYGLFGPRPVRLSAWGRRVSGLGSWLARVRQQPGALAVWTQGSGPLMALLVTAALLLAVATLASGHAQQAGWGGARLEDLLEDVHEALAEALGLLALAHVALVAALALWRGRAQVDPMLSGRVAGSGPDLVPSNRGALALALALALLALALWLPWGVDHGGGGASGDPRGNLRGDEARTLQHPGQASRRHHERGHDDDD